MNTLLNDRAFMVQFEKSKLEAKEKARLGVDLMVDYIYARMFVDLSEWVDANQQQTQQQLQTLPFIIETDGTTEFLAQISANAATIQSPLINQQQQETPKPPELPPSAVVKEEFTDSVTIIDNLPSKPSPEHLVTKCQPNTLSRRKSDNIIIGNYNNNRNLTKSINGKKSYGKNNQSDNNTNDNFRIHYNRDNAILHSGTIKFMINGNNINRNNINNQSITPISIANNNDKEMNCDCTECLLKEESNRVEDSFETNPEKEVNNVEMVEVQQQQQQSVASTRPYKCSKCYLRFEADSHRRNHEKTVHEKVGNTFWCTWKGCRFTGASRGNVLTHIRALHFGKQRNMITNDDDWLLDLDQFIRMVPTNVAARR